MRHRPFFRWVATLGVVLMSAGVILYALAPGFPETKQVDLAVLEEKPNGECRVRWTDPFGAGGQEADYWCDPDRDESLKAPHFDDETDEGWETGFVIAEGKHKGELEPASQEGYGIDDSLTPSGDVLLMFGLPLLAVGLVGGNIRAAVRVMGVRPGTVARAEKLQEAADQVARDHARAVTAVREAWDALRRAHLDEELARTPLTRLGRREQREVGASGVRTVRDVLDAGAGGLTHMGVDRKAAERAVAAARRVVADIEASAPARLAPDDSRPQVTALLVALHVLLDAGPEAREAARTGAELSEELERLITNAEPASEFRHMLRVSPDVREIARYAITELRALLATAEQEDLPRWFAQASVDLLRVPDPGTAGLSARADFETRTAQYYRLLAETVEDKAIAAPERRAEPTRTGLDRWRRRRP